MNFEKLPCCYFPTTIVAIDDNIEFLKLISFGLGRTLPCKIFDNPAEALNYLLMEYKEDSFVNRCIIPREEEDSDHCNIDVDIKAIHREVYNPKRFEQISVLLVDFAMPGINGAEICRQLKGGPFKIILLTGEAGEQDAIQQFNRGTIHRYIRKDDPGFLSTLKHEIQELQWEYFRDLSEILVNSLMNKAVALEHRFFPCLYDPVFVNFFSEFLKKHKFLEYYLLEESGSFLLLNDEGHLSWLLVKNDGDMEAAKDEALFESGQMEAETRDGILNKETLVHFFNEYESVLLPATKIIGKSNYYYSYVAESPVENDIVSKAILPFKKHHAEKRKAIEIV